VYLLLACSVQIPSVVQFKKKKKEEYEIITDVRDLTFTCSRYIQDTQVPSNVKILKKNNFLLRMLLDTDMVRVLTYRRDSSIVCSHYSGM
jgi:hypothetical protein